MSEEEDITLKSAKEIFESFEVTDHPLDLEVRIACAVYRALLDQTILESYNRALGVIPRRK